MVCGAGSGADKESGNDYKEGEDECSSGAECAVSECSLWWLVRGARVEGLWAGLTMVASLSKGQGIVADDCEFREEQMMER